MSVASPRPPLQDLGKNVALDNNDRRRVSRADDDHEGIEPPKKKARRDATMQLEQTAHGAAKADNIPDASTRTTRSRQSRIESNGDFQFSRTTSRQSSFKHAEIDGHAQTLSQQTMTITHTKVMSPVRRKPRGTLPVTPPRATRSNPQRHAQLHQSTNAQTMDKPPSPRLPVDAVALESPERKPQKSSNPAHKRRKTFVDSPDERRVRVKGKAQRQTKQWSDEHEQPAPAVAMQSSPRLQATKCQSPSSPARGNDVMQLRTPTNSASTTRSHDDSPALPQGALQPLHVAKRGGFDLEALKSLETPIAHRNKEMRRVAAANSPYRRSSSGLRGSRASSLLGMRTSSALPHHAVAAEDFFKHVSHTDPEQTRMRQLLVWSSDRALPKRPELVPGSMDAQVFDIAYKIQTAVQQDFANRDALSSWFDRPEDLADSSEKEVNPRNVQNAARLIELEAELERLRKEDQEWQDLESSTNGMLNTQIADANRQVVLDASLIDATYLDPDQANILASIFSIQDGSNKGAIPTSTATSLDFVANTRDTLQNMLANLEFKIDLFADSMHRLEQYRRGADRVAESILASGSARLEERDCQLKESANDGMASGASDAGPVRIETMDMLRALSRTGTAVKRGFDAVD